MATKLKKMRLTSVDLVRAGANQEADICLFKSADPQYNPDHEAAEEPTEAEANIFKRFLNWIRENPAEAESEAHSPIEKADPQPDLEYIYKSALAESLSSIMADETLTEIEKKNMSEESLRQYADKIQELERAEEDYDGGNNIDEKAVEEVDDFDKDDDLDDDDDTIEEEIIEEVAERRGRPEIDEIDEIEELKLRKKKHDVIEDVQKYNHNHGADGRFSSSPGAGGSTGTSPKGGAAKLGDFVDYGKEPHIVINETEETVTLRPVSRYGGEKDFDGGGDSFGDVHLDKWQMKDVKTISPLY